MGNDPTAEISLDNPGPFFFFQPDTARVRLPVNLPAALSSKLDEFRAKKDALKKELRDALYKQDAPGSNITAPPLSVSSPTSRRGGVTGEKGGSRSSPWPGTPSRPVRSETSSRPSAS